MMDHNRYSADDIEHDEALLEVQKRAELKDRLDVVLGGYSLFGVLLAIVGIAYTIFTTLDIHLTGPQMIGVIMSGVGVTLAVTSRALLLVRRGHQKKTIEQARRMQRTSEFLRAWANFETVSKRRLEQEDREFNRHSIREVIDLLHREGRLDDEDVRDLERVIQLRNSIVHQGSALSMEHARKIIDLLSSISQKVIEWK